MTAIDATGLAPDDGSGLRRARRDPAAFACFYRRHVRAVHAKCAREVDDDQLALDLTAEVFQRLGKIAKACHIAAGATPVNGGLDHLSPINGPGRNTWIAADPEAPFG